MPLYEYECETCGARFEVIQRFADASVKTCRTCEGPVHRLLSAPAIQFKGSGWYITDYARKGKSEPATVSSSSSTDSKPANGATSDSAKPAATTTTESAKPAAAEKKP
jgi:putative FmdB family regulatory protein